MNTITGHREHPMVTDTGYPFASSCLMGDLLSNIHQCNNSRFVLNEVGHIVSNRHEPYKRLECEEGYEKVGYRPAKDDWGMLERPNEEIFNPIKVTIEDIIKNQYYFSRRAIGHLSFNIDRDVDELEFTSPKLFKSLKEKMSLDEWANQWTEVELIMMTEEEVYDNLQWY